MTKQKYNFTQKFFTLGQTVLEKVRYGSAMDSILVLIVLVTIPCIGVYCYTRNPILLIIASTPVLYFFRAFDYLMKNHPSLLRSEKHEQKMFAMAQGLGHKNDELPEKVIDQLPASMSPSSSLSVKPQLIGKNKYV